MTSLVFECGEWGKGKSQIIPRPLASAFVGMLPLYEGHVSGEGSWVSFLEISGLKCQRNVHMEISSKQFEIMVWT